MEGYLLFLVTEVTSQQASLLTQGEQSGFPAVRDAEEMIFLEISALPNGCGGFSGVRLCFIPAKHTFELNELKKKCSSCMEVKIKEIAQKRLHDPKTSHLRVTAKQGQCVLQLWNRISG